MNRTVCHHHNRPSECQQCEDEIPTFLRGTDILQQELTTLRAHLTRAIDFIKKAGHLPGCGVERCRHTYDDGDCGMSEGSHIAFKHDFQPGPCGCGFSEVVPE